MKKGYEGKELIFGIRPEDVNAEPAFLETFPDCVVKATISVSELLGSESHLYCQVGKDEFVAKLMLVTTCKQVQQLSLDLT